jgi:hypothetical protein
MSNPQTNEKLALDEAYNEAIKEAIKYNFGFNQRLVESFYQTLNKTESQQESSVSTNNILVKKVKPLLQLVKKHDDKFVAYRRISYPKDEINQEVARLKNVERKELINESLVEEDQSQVLSTIVINSNPSLAKISLINKETNKAYYSSSNAKMIIPIGSYKIELSKPGFKPISQDYIVGTSNKDSHFLLEKIETQLFLNVKPKETIVKIDGRIYQNNTNISIAAGTHQISLSHPNFLSTSFDHIVPAEELTELKHVLLPKNSALYIRTEPEDALVYVNGKYIGESPLTGVELQLEQIEISIVKKGYFLFSEVVSINPNKNNIFSFRKILYFR